MPALAQLRSVLIRVAVWMQVHRLKDKRVPRRASGHGIPREALPAMAVWLQMGSLSDGEAGLRHAGDSCLRASRARVVPVQATVARQAQ